MDIGPSEKLRDSPANYDHKCDSLSCLGTFLTSQFYVGTTAERVSRDERDKTSYDVLKIQGYLINHNGCMRWISSNFTDLALNSGQICRNKVQIQT